MLAYIVLIFMIIIKIEVFISVDYIMYNQLILFFCLMNSQATGTLNEILNSIQYIKFDLKFMDYVFYARDYVNSRVWSHQQRDLTVFYLDSGSTFANYVNFVIVVLALAAAYLLLSALAGQSKVPFLQAASELGIRLVGNIKLYFTVFLLSLHFVCLSLVSESLHVVSSASSRSDLVSKVSVCANR